MQMSSARENILNKIKQALETPVPVPFPEVDNTANVFLHSQKELEVEFAENFTGLLGKFFFCLDERELAEQLTQLTEVKKLRSVLCNEVELKRKLVNAGYTNFTAPDVKSCDAAITGCELLISRTGSILMSSAQASGRTASVYAPIHICIATTKQLVYDLKDGLNFLKEKYRDNYPSFITFATGPSRTADIEKTLVVGVHGPREVYVFLLEE